MTRLSAPSRRRLVAVAATGAVLTLAGCSSSAATSPVASTTTAGAVSSAPGSTAPDSTSPSGAATGSSSAGTQAPVTVPTPVKVSGHEIQYHGQRDVRADTTTTVEMGDFYFSPSVLVGTAGQTLKVTVKNTGHAQHNFTYGKNVNVDLSSGDSKSVSVTFPSDGTAPFVCSFHIGAGMAGELVVAPS